MRLGESGTPSLVFCPETPENAGKRRKAPGNPRYDIID